MARIHYDAGFCPNCESLRHELTRTESHRNRLQGEVNALRATAQKLAVEVETSRERLSGALPPCQNVETGGAVLALKRPANGSP